MSCKYCAMYVSRALASVENFEKACELLHFDPKKKEDEEAIVKAFAAIGQFGTIRLARAFPWVTNEEEFHMVTLVGLHFYWMLLDAWEEIREKETSEQKRAKSSLL